MPLVSLSMLHVLLFPESPSCDRITLPSGELWQVLGCFVEIWRVIFAREGGNDAYYCNREGDFCSGGWKRRVLLQSGGWCCLGRVVLSRIFTGRGSVADVITLPIHYRPPASERPSGCSITLPQPNHGSLFYQKALKDSKSLHANISNIMQESNIVTG